MEDWKRKFEIMANQYDELLKQYNKELKSKKEMIDKIMEVLNA